MSPTPTTTETAHASTPLAALTMHKLPLGAVRAEGWLQHQLELMVDGMFGHLEEISAFLAADNGWFVDGNEGWEEQPYWLRGFYSLAVLTGDERCLAAAKRWIEAVLASQKPDGWFGSDYHRRHVGRDGAQVSDLWGHMVMLWPLRDHYEYSGDERVLALMERFFAYCAAMPDEEFIQQMRGGTWQDYREECGDWKVGVQVKRAGDMIPHLHWLYERSGDESLLSLATRFFNAVLPPVHEFIDIHTVHFAQRHAYAALYGRQAELTRGLEESEYWYQQMMAVWGQQPRGAFAADEMIRLGKIDPRQGIETCTMVEFALKFYELGRLSGDGIYADRVEDLYFNHFPAAQMPDLTGLHYLTASNCPELGCGTNHDLRNEEQAREQGREYPMLRYSARDYRCCQHNVAQGWPYFVQNLWQRSADGGLVAWLYAASTVSHEVDGTRVTLRQATDYPFDGTIAITVEDGAAAFPLSLRVPGWSRGVSLKVNGEVQAAEADARGLIRLERRWQPGDRVEVTFAMELSHTRWPRNGALTIDRGPLSYSLRIEEDWRRLDDGAWPSWAVHPISAWNYGLVLRDGAPEVAAVERSERIAAQPWSIEVAPIELRVRARRIPEWGYEAEPNDGSPQELRKSPIRAEGEDEFVRMIPLGCARLRMSCLPEVSDAPHAQRWKAYRDY